MTVAGDRMRTRERVGAANRAAYREAILAAAAEVFGRLGYAQAKIADIADAAGIAAGTVYNYFESKEAVFAAIVDRGRLELVQRLAAAEAGHRGLSRLRTLLRALFEMLDEQASMFAVWLEVAGLPGSSLRSSDPCVGAGQDDITARLHAAVTDAIAQDELRKDMSPDDLVLCIAGALNATFVRWGSRPEPRGSVRAEAERVLEILLHGAVPR